MFGLYELDVAAVRQHLRQLRCELWGVVFTTGIDPAQSNDALPGVVSRID